MIGVSIRFATLWVLQNTWQTYRNRLRKKKGILSEPEKKKGRPLSNDITSKVIDFYKSDDISVNLPGKKNFFSIINDDDQRENIKKKLISCNLKESYEIFKEQNPDNRTGFSSFASLRPLHCVLAGSGGTHTVCVCAVHQNIKLMMLGSNIASLTHHMTIPLVQYKNCFKLILL
ncbi:uncharacterized protein LOC141527219 [Cotesia typhae]|uniref:uncharacterized protein LOC141527219 n=1 Tax=Cotesia typhae TaxID=2053667 RepID=UPI003D69AC17